MPTISTRLGLKVPSTVDPFVTQDIADNWETLDDSPGIFVCTSTTHPSWDTNQRGRCIIENDTDLIWRWNGSIFRRVAPSGLLKLDSGADAVVEMVLDSTIHGASGDPGDDFQVVGKDPGNVDMILRNVVVPAGGRTIMVIASWTRSFTDESSGLINYGGAIFRSRTDNTGTKVGAWQMDGKQGETGSGGSYVAMEVGGLSAGTYDWSFQVAPGPTNTVTVVASADRPCRLVAIEI